MPAAELAGDSGRLARQAVVQAVAQEIQARAGSLAASADTDLKLSRDGKIIWQQAAVGEVQLGDGLLALRAEVLADDTLTGLNPCRNWLRARGWRDSRAAWLSVWWKPLVFSPVTRWPRM